MVKKILSMLFCLAVLFGGLTVLSPTVWAADGGASVTYEEILDATANMIRSHEGNYDSVNPNDNGALSIGCLQWHAGRALSLCRSILEKDPDTALSILGKSLYNEILDPATVWTSRVLVSDKNVSDDESDRISDFISTEIGIAEQDALIKKDVSTYLDRAIGLGITDPVALVYFADVENQCGSGGSKRIAAAAAEIAGSYGEITLDILHKAALEDVAAGKYATRRNKAYNSCLVLSWSNFSSDLEVWTLKATRYVRATPDTKSELVTTVYAGTNLVIIEKAYFEGVTRGRTSMGWITLDSSSCILNEELSGGYVPAPVIFDTAGGTFVSKSRITALATGVNIPRTSGTLVVYDSSYSSSATLTNAYGTEIAVDSTGLVLSAPVYGTCKTNIPEGGFVLSGHGGMSAWLCANVSKGNYIYFDKASLEICVYPTLSEYAFANPIELLADGINVYRGADELIIYDNGYESSATKTNPYGTEVAVDSTGLVLNDPVYGICKTEIPEGGFVISAHGEMQRRLALCVKKGYYVHRSDDGSTVTIYGNRNLYIAHNKTVIMNCVFGELPTPAKARYSFSGWYNEDTGKYVTMDTVCTTPFCVELTAVWEELPAGLLKLDTDGGAIKGLYSSKVNGINAQRLADQLIVYNVSGASTGTNEYGREAVVSADGYITKVYDFGVGSTVVPEGGFVISANGTAAAFVKEKLKVGMYVVFDSEGMELFAYESKSLYDSINKGRYEGEAVGVLPDCEKEYYSFLGWYTPTGERVTESTVMPAGGMILKAKWKLLPGSLTFDTDGGTLGTAISAYPLKGINAQRSTNELVLYKDISKSTASIYGSEALIDKNGCVAFVYPYGAAKNEIPKGCSILSGHGNASQFVKSLCRGQYIEISGGTVTVWDTKNAYLSRESTAVLYGEKYPTLPIPEKEGYMFLGWTDGNGNYVYSGSTVSLLGNIKLTAVWEKLCKIKLDTSQGEFSYTNTAVAKGINIVREANSLVIYGAMEKSTANVYGWEAVADSSGKILSVAYGGKNTIPEGGFVLSGHGTMASWIKDNIRVGSVVTLDGYNVKVYSSENAYNMKDNTFYVRKGAALGALPKAVLLDNAFTGWISNGLTYTQSSVVSSDLNLKATWTPTKASLIFDTRGGSFRSFKVLTSLTAINDYRGSGALVLYDKSYSAEKTPTNAYGTEIVVDHFGIVLADPVYGTNKTEIPEKGFVLSGHGAMSSWLINNVKAGNYINVDRKTMAVEVYESYGDYIAKAGKTITYGKVCGELPIPVREGYTFVGWMNYMGEDINESTVITDCSHPTLYAKWKKNISLTFNADGGEYLKGQTTLTGTNVHRGAEAMVLYTGVSATGTNPYGTEIVADSSGRVIVCNPYGKGNSAVPEGGFVLSGHGAQSRWLASVSVGNYIRIENGSVLLYENSISYAAECGVVTLVEGTALSELPVPLKYGYTLEGWFDNEGSPLALGTVLSENGVYTAKWTAKITAVSFDANGGSLPLPKELEASGKNIPRQTDSLIIYDSSYGASTGTNINGTEVVVGADGIVSEIRLYGTKDAPIPEGGFVLSGHGTSSGLLKENIKVGSYVVIDGLEITVCEHPSHVHAVGKTVTFGAAFGALPIPQREGMTFLGWFTSDGVLVTESTVLSVEADVLCLKAKWG